MEVDVQGVVGPLPQGGFHVRGGGVGGPVVADVVGGGVEGEVYGVGGVGCVECGGLREKGVRKRWGLFVGVEGWKGGMEGIEGGGESSKAR